MIIEAKLKSNIPLALTEKLAIARREETKKYLEESKAQAQAQTEEEAKPNK